MKNHEEIAKITGKNLTKLYNNLGLKKSYIKEKTNVSYTTINNWLDGKKIPSKKNLEKLSKIMKVSKDDIKYKNVKEINNKQFQKKIANYNANTLYQKKLDEQSNKINEKLKDEQNNFKIWEYSKNNMNPTIYENSFLFINPKSEIKTNKILAIKKENEIIVGRLKKCEESSEYVLTYDNPQTDFESIMIKQIKNNKPEFINDKIKYLGIVEKALKDFFRYKVTTTERDPEKRQAFIFKDAEKHFNNGTRTYNIFKYTNDDMEPMIRKNSIVYVSPENNFSNGNMIAVSKNDKEILIRRCWKFNDPHPYEKYKYFLSNYPHNINDTVIVNKQDDSNVKNKKDNNKTIKNNTPMLLKDLKFDSLNRYYFNKDNIRFLGVVSRTISYF